jgi:hypothetical protein
MLVAGAVAAGAGAGGGAGVLLVRHERSDDAERGAIGRTRSAMSAVDAEIRGHFTTLQALACLEDPRAGRPARVSTRRRSAWRAASPTG